MSDLNLDKLSPRLRKLIAYTFENAYTLDGGEGDLKPVGGIGVSLDDLFYVLNMAARAEMAQQEEESES